MTYSCRAMSFLPRRLSLAEPTDVASYLLGFGLYACLLAIGLHLV